MFEVVESNGREILSLKSLDESNPLTSSPLEQLDSVLKSIPTDQAYSLKRELLVGVVPQSGETLTASGAASMCDSLLPLSALSSHSLIHHSPPLLQCHSHYRPPFLLTTSPSTPPPPSLSYFHYSSHLSPSLTLLSISITFSSASDHSPTLRFLP